LAVGIVVELELEELELVELEVELDLPDDSSEDGPFVGLPENQVVRAENDDVVLTGTTNGCRGVLQASPSPRARHPNRFSSPN
jgi:hypothetical protein